MRHDRQYADDIVRACDRILDYLAGRSADDFGNTALVQDAVIRQILVIGEATKRLSQEFRDSTADVPWTKVAGCATYSFTDMTASTSVKCGAPPRSISPELAAKLRQFENPSA